MHIREVREYLDDAEKTLLNGMLKAAKEYAAGYTGQSLEYLEKHEEVSIAILTLVSDMWDNRQMYVDKSNANRVVETILGMHSVNLLPTAEVGT